MYPEPYYSTSPLHKLPAGTVALTRFSIQCDVAQNVVMRHVLQGIDGEHIAVTKVIWHGRLCRYLTPVQQQAAFEFWDKHGVRYRKPVLTARKSEVRL